MPEEHSFDLVRGQQILQTFVFAGQRILILGRYMPKDKDALAFRLAGEILLQPVGLSFCGFALQTAVQDYESALGGLEGIIRRAKMLFKGVVVVAGSGIDRHGRFRNHGRVVHALLFPGLVGQVAGGDDEVRLQDGDVVQHRG